MKKRTKDRHLPARMYFKHGAYYYVYRNEWTRLGVDYSDALHEYARLIAPPSTDRMGGVIDKVLEHISPRLKPNTITQYKIAAERLKSVMAEFAPEQVKPKHIAAIKTHYAQTPNMANRMISFLRVVFQYAVEWQLVESNPCIGIKRHTENKRDRYINDAEYDAIKSHASPTLAAIMDICYLTGQRIGDVLAIKLTDIDDKNGIDFQQQKTNKRLRVAMTPDLRDAIARAKALRPANVRAFTLFYSRGGKSYSYFTIRDMFKRAREAAGIENVTIHDLRAKSLTDANREGLDAQKLAGHSNAQMTKRYIRMRDTDVAQPPSIRQRPKS